MGAYCTICTTQEPNREACRDYATAGDGLCDFHRVKPRETTDKGFLVCGEGGLAVFVSRATYAAIVKQTFKVRHPTLNYQSSESA